GNFWSDYSGFDANADGIGDVPYRAMSLFESLIDREPKLRLFLYSPAQQAIELASRAFPVMAPQAKITDTAPLMAPVDTAPSVRRASSATWTGTVLPEALLMIPALLMQRMRRSAETMSAEPASAVAAPRAASVPDEPIRVSDALVLDI